MTTIEDDTLSKGTVGFTIEMFEENTSAMVEFDELTIWSGED